MAKVYIESKDIPKGVGRQLAKDLVAQYPGAVVDTTFVDGRTVTPKDKDGKELPVVFLPGSITIEAPGDSLDPKSVLDFVKSKSYEKTDKQLGESKKAAELFKLLMLVPEFKALFDKK